MATSVYFQSQIIDSEAEAIIRLEKLVEKDSVPALSSDDIQQLLNDNKVGTVWAASTTYYEGDVIVPSQGARNGRSYKATQRNASGTTGVSGTTEPGWPLAGAQAFAGRRSFSSHYIGDGTVLWLDNGPEMDLWNVRKAAWDGWMRKAGKAANMFDNKVGDDSFSCSQVYDHCIAMAKHFVSAPTFRRLSRA
jgi:hypothetical protein